jgi:hypothetical protein
MASNTKTNFILSSPMPCLVTRATPKPKQTTNKIDDIFEEVINGQ